jgi:hypothetical protein
LQQILQSMLKLPSFAALHSSAEPQ